MKARKLSPAQYERLQRAALAAAAAAGGSPKDFNPLPRPEDLPLAFAALEARVEMLEQKLGRYRP
jgi:hypothetical protein